ncbi:MAG: glycosyltransferase [Planctomycetes bacterium]|nr:glycosyltransferase [Planctomycetota bacterium]
MAATPATSATTVAISKVLHVVHGYYPESGGGTEAYVRSLLDAQTRLSMQPYLLHGSFEPRPAPALEARDDLPVEAWRLHRADTYSDYWDKAHYAPAGQLFEQILDDVEPDIVHVHQWIRMTDDLVVRALRRGIRSLVSLHDLYSSCPACFRLRPDDSHCERVVSFDSCADCVPLRGHESREEVRCGIDLYRDNARRELMSAGRVLAATEATRTLVTRGLGLDRDLVHLEPLGYERRFGNTNHEQSREGALRLAYWGNVTARKGVDVLLDAMRILEAREPLRGRLELTIFGKVDLEELRRDLEQRASGLPVTFAGRYEWEELAAHGIGLAAFPSTCFETYGFVLDEAFELGVPALVTDVGAFAERIHAAGFLVPPHDAVALADALERILQDSTLLDRARASIPALSPTPLEHARRLCSHYEVARSASPSSPPSLSARRDALDELRERGDRDRAPLQRGLSD